MEQQENEESPSLKQDTTAPKPPNSSKPKENMIACNNCKMVPDNYVALNCLHNFCLPCLSKVFIKLLEKKNFFLKSASVVINCPICREPTELDKPSLEALEEVILILGDLNELEEKNKRKFEVIYEDSNEQIQTEENTNNNNFNQNSVHSFSQKDYNETLSESSLKQQQPIKEMKKKKDKKEILPFKQQKDNEYDSLSPEKIMLYEEEPKESSVNSKKRTIQNQITQIAACERKNCFLDPKLPMEQEDFLQNCAKHPEEKSNLFCFTCNEQNFCIECLMSGQHRNHMVCTMGNCIQVLEEKYGELKKEVHGQEEVLQLVLERLGKKKQKVIEEKDEQWKKVSNEFRKLHEIINAKQNEIGKFLTNMAYEAQQSLEDSFGNVIQQQQSIDKFDNYFARIKSNMCKSPIEISELFNFYKTIKEKPFNCSQQQSPRNCSVFQFDVIDSIVQTNIATIKSYIESTLFTEHIKEDIHNKMAQQKLITSPDNLINLNLLKRSKFLSPQQMDNSFLERQLTDRSHIKTSPQAIPLTYSQKKYKWHEMVAQQKKFKSMNSEKLRFHQSPQAYHVDSARIQTSFRHHQNNYFIASKRQKNTDYGLNQLSQKCALLTSSSTYLDTSARINSSLIDTNSFLQKQKHKFEKNKF